jgi:uncharacterized membrane protein YsdA (DUF1294 family)
MEKELVYIGCIYLVLINSIGFILTGFDKYWAVHNKWRLAEKKFIILAVFGAGLGVFIGCLVFHHKIRNRTFMLGIPAILVTEIVLTLVLIFMSVRGQIELSIPIFHIIKI